MTKNVGGWDKLVRWIIGAALLGFSFKTEGFLSLLMIVMALALIGTALAGWCGLYTLMGVNTACKMKTPEDPPSDEGPKQ